jgi:OmpA-OmpF porin, OOP family
MKKWLGIVAALGLTASLGATAQAQTGPVTGYNWSGLYLGANLGGGFGSDKTTAGPGSDPTSLFDFGGPTNSFGAGSLPSSFKTDPSGFIGGIQARYNWQFGSAVLGADLEADGASISGKQSKSNAGGLGGPPPGFVPSTSFASQSLDFLTTLRGQVGFTPIDRLLLFANAGPAVGHVNYSASFSYPSLPGQTWTADRSQFNFGGTVGTGLEYAVTDNLTVRGEYMFVDLGNQKIGTSASPLFPGASINTQFHNTYNIFRLGVAYHFAAPSAPPATPVVAAPPAPPAAIAASQQKFIVFFEFDKSALTPDGAKVVAAAANAFKSGKSGITIAGYTDLSGTQQYNLALSHRRADAVKAALVKDGVSASAIGESWHGKEDPRVPTADGVREPQNRRVEITL